MTATTRRVTSNVRIPAELWERLRERAFRTHISINALIVEAIAEKIEQGKRSND